MPRHSDSILFVTNTNVGVDIGVDPLNQTPQIEVGYNRAEGVYLPLYVYGDNQQIENEYANHRGRLAGDESLPNPDEGGYSLGNLVDLAVDKVAAAEKKFNSDPTNNRSSAHSILIEAQEIMAAVTNGSAPKSAVTALAIKELNGLVSDPSKISKDSLSYSLNLLKAAASQPAYRSPINPEGIYQGQYVELDGNGKIIKKRVNAYSVLGTFAGDLSSNANASSTEAKMDGGIVQFFATGIAADILAEGRAELVSVPAAEAKPAVVEAEANKTQADAQKIRAQSDLIRARAAENTARSRANLNTAQEGILKLEMVVLELSNLPDDSAREVRYKTLGFVDPVTGDVLSELKNRAGTAFLINDDLRSTLKNNYRNYINNNLVISEADGTLTKKNN